MRDVNQETITGTLSWYKILPLDGFSLIRVKRRRHMRQREVCQNSWSRRTNPKLFTPTTRWNLGKHFNTSDPRQLSAILLQSGLDERWWSDSLERYCSLRNVQDLLADGKTPYERRFAEPFKGPISTFGSNG